MENGNLQTRATATVQSLGCSSRPDVHIELVGKTER